MSKQIEDGGPAFPHQDASDTGTRPGMTLRDYFAAKAMHARMADSLASRQLTATAARWAYEMADAMLAARGDV